jgi:glycosyltransferase involved in cell wall biosynthesis
VTITFIVCTRNRASILPMALNAIAAEASAHPSEIDLVIVDDGSSDNTRSVLAAWAECASLQVSIVELPRRGLAAARNAGMAAAKGRLLAFTDDDCVLAPGYMRDLRGHYGKDAEAVIRGGRVELGDPKDLPFTVKTSDTRVRMRPGMHPGTVVLGCNMVIPRIVADVVGTFDERFGAGTRFKAGEDADYVYRAHLMGIAVEYVPDMAVRHFHGRREYAEVLRLSTGYFLGNGALYAKHLRNGWLIHNLRWDIAKAASELVGGESLDPVIGLSYRRMILQNLRGMALYLFDHGGPASITRMRPADK